MSSAASLIRRLLGRAPAGPPLPPFNHSRNRFKAKKPWPPDMSKMSHVRQFRLEKKWKKRRAMKWMNPTWMKWTKIAQWSIISGVVIFAVLFMDYSNDPLNPKGEQPFQWVRVYSILFTIRHFSPRDRYAESFGEL